MEREPLKRCTKCGTEKPLSEFYVEKKYGKPTARCKQCYRDVRKEYVAKNREHVLAQKRDFYERNRDKVRAKIGEWNKNNRDKRREANRRWVAANREQNRINNITWRYGISVEQLRLATLRQGGMCAICGAKKSARGARNLHVDHCHRTGIFRGLLCDNCNAGIGHFKDKIWLLKRAISYLKETLNLRNRMASHIEITATLLSERRPPNCDNFFICQFRAEGGDLDGLVFTAVGNADEGDLIPSMTYRLWGGWAEDRRYGKQFKVATFVLAAPHGHIGITRYLEQMCDGVGKATAEQLWNKFNHKAVEICREKPQLVHDLVPRLSLEKCQAMAEALKNAKSMESVSIDLIDFFAGYHIPKSVYKEALRRYGNRAVELFRLNPYLMLSFSGIGFLKADSIYCQIGLPPAKTKRQVHCLAYEMKQSEDTWFSESSATQLLQKKISGTNVDLSKTIALGLRAKKFQTKRHCSTCRGTGRGKVRDLFDGLTMVDGPCLACRGSGGQKWMALDQRATNEQIVAEKVAALLRTEPGWPDVGQVKGISDSQRLELHKSFRGSIGAFIGGPGTGKTFTISAATKLLLEVFGEGNVAAASPTNKAAVRLTQGFRANDIGLTATSIHSLLGVEKVEDGNWEFRHSRRNPFKYRVILLEESSMLGTDLAACVFDAILPGTLVLMIGDTGQLPPIQHGAVLRDLLTAKVPCGELTEPQRNAGDLVFACQDIKQGRRFRESTEIDLKSLPPKNFKFIQARTPEEQIEQLYKLLDWAKEIGLDPVWDCQVMSAVNKTSRVSREVLNKLLQERFNPGDQANFRPKDKVICDDNGFYEVADVVASPPAGARSGKGLSDLELRIGQYAPDGQYATDGDGEPPSSDDSSSDNKTFIAKGEFGQVVAIEKKHVIVKFDGDGRTVRLPLGRERRSSVPADGGSVESSCPVQLAYSCTVHRMQGSECKLAIPMIDESAGAKWLGCRELFFTAISRGKLLTRPIGNRSTADQMCRKVSIGKRKTFLSQLVSEYAKGWDGKSVRGAADQPPAVEVVGESVFAAGDRGGQASTDLVMADLVG